MARVEEHYLPKSVRPWNLIYIYILPMVDPIYPTLAVGTTIRQVYETRLGNYNTYIPCRYSSLANVHA